MINPDYSIEEIETRFFNFLKHQVGEFGIIKHINQMTGGNEAYLYRFRVKGIQDMDKPLVLRLFPSFYNANRADWEGLIHNLLNQQGLPVPKVHLTSSDTAILGGSFMVMDFIEGDAINPVDDMSILKLAARTQAMLHQIDGKPISEKILALGHSAESHSLDGRINWLLDRAKKYSELGEIFQWIIDKKPKLEKTSLVHGDFHPLNMLVKDGLVTAILDWSGFIVGDPMAGLGWTLAILIASEKHMIPKELFEEAIRMYNAEYEKVGHIDHDKLNYFVVFRLAMALLEGLDGQEYWTKPEIVNTIVNELKELTGISVKLAHAECFS